jgi:hypothetical protein
VRYLPAYKSLLMMANVDGAEEKILAERQGNRIICESSD